MYAENMETIRALRESFVRSVLLYSSHNNILRKMRKVTYALQK
jgi:hypothetical protein